MVLMRGSLAGAERCRGVERSEERLDADCKVADRSCMRYAYARGRGTRACARACISTLARGGDSVRV
eukprot:5959654-Pleurochrysis_carterae.AAC.1